jgi:hypothetical protein
MTGLSQALEWMDKHAGGVQALSSVTVAILTAALIWVTRHYASTTDRYAETADLQLKEATLAREAMFRPYLHVFVADFGSSNRGHEPSGTDYVIVQYANVGPGVALSIWGTLATPVDTFSPNEKPPTVTYADGNSTRLCLELPNQQFVKDDHLLCGDGVIKISYRDLLNHSWITEVPICIVMKPHRGDEWAEIAILDQQEQVYRGELVYSE